MAKIENDFRRALCSALTLEFGDSMYQQKNHGNAFSSGLVDMEFVYQGQSSFVELKATDEPVFNWNKVTRLQLDTMRRLFQAGALPAVVVYFKEARGGRVARVGYKDTNELVRSGEKTTWQDLYHRHALVFMREDLLTDKEYLSQLLQLPP